MDKKKRYKIIKSFNNNVVLCTKNRLQYILIGKGIGFGVKPNQIIKDIDRIEKEFSFVDKKNKENFKNLSDEIDNCIIGITEEAIAVISEKLGGKLNEKIHITLLDHISFAVERYKNNVSFNNPFLDEMKFLYKEPFGIAEEVLKIINEKLDIELPVDEAGFIAMHIHAAMNNINLSKATLNTTIIMSMVDFIEEKFEEEIEKESVEYIRLVTHLRFAIDRAQKNIEVKNIILGSIKENYVKSFDVSKQLSKFIKQQYNIIFSEEEMGYIAVHLQTIFTNCN